MSCLIWVQSYIILIILTNKMIRNFTQNDKKDIIYNHSKYQMI